MKRSEKLFELYLKAKRIEARWARRQTPAFDWRQMARRICDHHEVQLKDVLTGSRARHLVYVRWQIMFELRQRGWSFAQIGRAFGRDHSAVMHGVKGHARRMEKRVQAIMKGMKDV
jgi:chromosomal replication initiation ATPase DnaA